MLVRKILAVTVLAVSIMLLVPISASASVASEPIYTVMNAPQGVWFRNSPHSGDTDHVSGHGGYDGNNIELECYAFGDVVGDHNNTLWYYVSNLTHPSVPGTGVLNEGYLSSHYINDRLKNGAAVPTCGGSVYYSPSPTNFIVMNNGDLE